MIRKNINFGFALLEVIFAVVVIGIIGAIIFSPLSSFKNSQLLRGTTENVLAVIEESRSLTLSSHESNQYGIHLETDSITLFTGPTYLLNDPSNRVSSVESGVSISSWALQGGGDDIIFERLTGETEQYGTITVTLSTGVSKTITVSRLGNVSSS